MKNMSSRDRLDKEVPMDMNMLYHARVIQDIMLRLKEFGEYTIRLGTEESAAIIAGHKLAQEKDGLSVLSLLVDNGSVIAKRSDLDYYQNLKAALAKAGGQPLESIRAAMKTVEKNK